MKIYFLIMLVYPGWQNMGGPTDLETCLARKHENAMNVTQIPLTPLIRFECVAHWNVPDKILWAF